jgi:ssDNA-binding replication factor A large subunit
MIVDNDGVLRAVLWNKKAELVEGGELKAGQAVRLMHGYTKEDRYGKVELHLGERSQIEVERPEKASQYPTIEKFAAKIRSLNETSGSVNLCGTVKQVLGSSTFKRSDDTEGTVMRFVLADDSGEITAVAWNEKATELEKTLKANASLQLVNARVKEGMKGGLEVHVDSSTYVGVQDSPATNLRKASLSKGLVGYFSQ